MKHLKTFEKLDDNDIFDAIRYNDDNRIEKLVNSGINIDELSFNGWTPLCYASYYNKYKLIKKLINLGANINYTTNNGNTALILASKHNKSLSTIILIEAGADWNIKDKFNKDFLDYLSDDQKQEIINDYPEKYQEYLMKKEAEKYNI